MFRTGETSGLAATSRELEAFLQQLAFAVRERLRVIRRDTEDHAGHGLCRQVIAVGRVSQMRT